MNSVTTNRFRKAFEKLPVKVQVQTRLAYKLWKDDHYHPSLSFKKIHATQPIYSVRIGLSYRALGIQNEGVMIWFWIGSHEEYNHLINHL